MSSRQRSWHARTVCLPLLLLACSSFLEGAGHLQGYLTEGSQALLGWAQLSVWLGLLSWLPVVLLGAWEMLKIADQASCWGGLTQHLAWMALAGLLYLLTCFLSAGDWLRLGCSLLGLCCLFMGWRQGLQLRLALRSEVPALAPDNYSQCSERDE